MRRTLFLVPALALALGCGQDDEPETIDCSWFETPNCWTEVRDAAAACTDDEASGTLSADHLTCDYDDGAQVVFDPAPPADFDNDDYSWSFSILGDGESCMSFEQLGPDGEDGFRVSSSAGTFRHEISGFSFVLTCPDGAEYEIGMADAFECDLSLAPGYGYSVGGSASTYSASFSLLSPAEVSSGLFYCRASDTP